jgi:hypothetical protein
VEKAIKELRASAQEYRTRITTYVQSQLRMLDEPHPTHQQPMHTQQGLLPSGPARDEAGRVSLLAEGLRPATSPPLLVDVPVLALHQTRLRTKRSTRAEGAFRLLNVTPLLLLCRNPLSTAGDDSGSPCDALQLDTKF